jgi:ribonucleoside-diphosphate reductase beta chain
MSKLTEERAYFKPFNYAWAYDAWLKHEQSHWLHTEVPMSEDVKDWNTKLSDGEKGFLTNIFRFFVQGDIDVAGGYVNNYLPHFPQPEVRMMLVGFAAREALHVAAYSHLIETLGMPESTYNEFLEYDAMKDKHEYFMGLSNSDQSISTVATNIAAFSAFTEGMQLFSSFIMLLNFPRHGKMKGMGQIITWSIVDETLHSENMIKLFREYINENIDIWNDDLKGKIYTIAEKMVELEDKFIDLAFALGPMEGLTAEEVKKYIRYICDRRLISLGMKGIFKVKKNPLLWVESMINAPTHTNFFENRSTDYAKGALLGDWGDVWA